MPRRKRFAEEWEIPPEAKPPEVIAREPAEERDEETRGTSEDAVTGLQGSVGNRALSRMLIQRLVMPGVDLEEGPPELGKKGSTVPDVADLRAKADRGLKELGTDPTKHVANFLELGDKLPDTARELLKQADAAASGASYKGMDAHLLKLNARSKLTRLPEGTKLPDALGLADNLCEAINVAWMQWKLQAFFKNVVIQGPLAIGGEIEGPPLGPFVLAHARTSTAEEMEAAQAVAGAVEGGMKQWQQSAKIPALPLYPAFSAFPGPMAPPMPNIPFPVGALIHDPNSFTKMTASGRARDPGAVAVAQAVLDAVGAVYPIFAASQMVMLMMGKGPIPTFAPPYVPVGPVVGGEVIPVPGHFMT